MKQSLLWGIAFSFFCTIKPFSFISVLQTLGPYILPSYALKRAFDKNEESGMRSEASATSTQHCPVTIDGHGKAFIGCTVNGALHMDGAGNTHTAHDDPAVLAVQELRSAVNKPIGFIKRLSNNCIDAITARLEWMRDHKFFTASSCVFIGYLYSLARVAYLQRYIVSNTGWGSWHTECNWELLSPHEQSLLREELLVEVRRRYPYVTDAVPVHCFMNDVDSEIAVYTQYMTLIDRIQQLDTVRRIITDRFKDAYSGLLGNTQTARMRSEQIFEYCALAKWLRVNNTVYTVCVKKREHLRQLKAFYAEWLTTVRAIYKEKK